MLHSDSNLIQRSTSQRNSDSDKDAQDPQLPSCTVCLAQLQFHTAKTERDSYTCALMCGHTFHARCLSSWHQVESTCPVCRKKVTDDNKIARLYFGPETDFKYEKQQGTWKIIQFLDSGATSFVFWMFAVFASIATSMVFFMILLSIAIAQKDTEPEETRQLRDTKFLYFQSGISIGIAISVCTYAVCFLSGPLKKVAIGLLMITCGIFMHTLSFSMGWISKSDIFP